MGLALSEGDFKIVDQNRFDAVYYSTHNHRRFVRISACLSVTGFRWIGRAFAGFIIKVVEEKKMPMSRKEY